MTQLWISTTNQNKLNEFKNILGSQVEIHSVSELSFYSAPPETGKTFADNARIKAKTLKALKPGTWVVADDSGLEAEGLGGLPGVHSARYAGDKAGDGENVAKLLKMIQIRSAQNRKAQMTCVLVAYDPQGARAARELLPGVELASDAYACAAGADALVVITEWDAFRDLDLGRLAKAMREPVMVDLRNIFADAPMAALGFRYEGLGRGKRQV